jgi:hypothetical protein
MRNNIPYLARLIEKGRPGPTPRARHLLRPSETPYGDKIFDGRSEGALKAVIKPQGRYSRRRSTASERASTCSLPPARNVRGRPLSRRVVPNTLSKRLPQGPSGRVKSIAW